LPAGAKNWGHCRLELRVGRADRQQFEVPHLGSALFKVLCYFVEIARERLKILAQPRLGTALRREARYSGLRSIRR
jgi:hypothetical protein